MTWWHGWAPRVRIANDANCFTLSEARDGSGRGANVVFGVILGTGVGGGIVMGGNLLTGANGVGGEWGHTPMPYLHADWVIEPHLRECEARLGSRRCYCGRMDCVETWLSGPGLALTYENSKVSGGHRKRSQRSLRPPWSSISRCWPGRWRRSSTSSIRMSSYSAAAFRTSMKSTKGCRN